MAKPQINLSAISLQDQERFWNRIEKLETGCWEWQAFRNRKGYGQMSLQGRLILAHRFSFYIHNGHLSSELFVMHICDNPPCCNPAHLRLGTNKENMQDAAQKGRMPKGNSHPFRLNPSLIANYGARNGANTCPESVARGERHWTRRLPEQIKRGNERKNTILTPDLVCEIRAKRLNGYSQQRLADEYGVDRKTIAKVVNRETWKHI